MKNKILSLAIMFLPILVRAQEPTPRDFTLQEASIGLRFTGGIYYSHPCDLFWSLAPSVNLVTNITHHHLMFDVFSQSVQTLNGYMLGKGFDVYCFFQKSIPKPDKYLSIGAEKMMILRRKNPAGEFTIQTEIGTDFHKLSGRFAIVFEPQFVFFRGYDK